MSKAAEPEPPQDTGDDEDEREESTWLKLRTPGSEFDAVRAALSCCAAVVAAAAAAAAAAVHSDNDGALQL
eukprot:COSAG02_NODE_12827_length_1486_cov_2.085797_1_plen_71_part_00